MQKIIMTVHFVSGNKKEFAVSLEDAGIICARIMKDINVDFVDGNNRFVVKHAQVTYIEFSEVTKV